MNGIHQYFLDIATASIHRAAGDIVAKGNVNAHLVIDTMLDLTSKLSALISSIECDVKYVGYVSGAHKSDVSVNIEPTFDVT